MQQLEVVQISVGTPHSLGRYRGREVFSSIEKHGIGSSLITVTPDGIEGDEQADKRVVRGKRIHGGPLQAINVYPLSHLELWASELDMDVQPGATFGENLTVVGANEYDVRVGDVFQWGDVTLRASKYRRPCYKLPLHLKVGDAAKLMQQNGRCGWYCEVLRPGTVSPDSSLELVSVGAGPTIAKAFADKIELDSSIPDD